MARLVSLNVGQPREVAWNGKTTSTSIFKEPVQGSRKVTALNIEGDRQADLAVHGGPDKAVYAYSAEHYEFWKKELNTTDLPWGSFGENLTTEGVEEKDLKRGDHLKIGTAEFVVTDPREPCFKLAIRFQRADVVKKFQHSGRFGFYLGVTKEGQIKAGDEIIIASGG